MSRSAVRMARLAIGATVLTIVLAACGAASPTSAGPALATTAPAASAPPAPVPAVASATAVRPTPTPPVAVACSPRVLTVANARNNLSGAWLGDDGGVYYLRQIENILWWSGMSGASDLPRGLGLEWTSVATGSINADRTIHLSWADVPRGYETRFGARVGKIEDDGTGEAILKLSDPDNFAEALVLKPCDPG